MHILCTQEKLKKAIHTVERFSGRNATLPILGHILLKAEKNTLSFFATNLEIGVIAKISARVEQEGVVAIPSTLLSGFTTQLFGEDNISLKHQENTLFVHCGNFSAKIPTSEGKDFPIIPQSNSEPFLLFSGEVLEKAFSHLMPHIATNETRPELTGVNLLFSQDKISCAATDSFRLAEEEIILTKENKTKEYDSFVAKTTSVIIPAQTIRETTRIIAQEQKEVRICVEEKQIFFFVGDIFIVSRLIDGKYPDYQQIIPQKHATEIVVSCEEMTQALRMATTFTSQKNSEITISFEEGAEKITLSSRSQDTGEQTTVVKTQAQGVSQCVVLNPRFVLEGIAGIAEPFVRILLNSNTAPVVFCGSMEKTPTLTQNKQPYLFLVMPIKSAA